MKKLICLLLVISIFFSGCSGYQTRVNNINLSDVKKELDKSDNTNLIITVLVVAGIITVLVLHTPERHHQVPDQVLEN